MSQAVKAGLPLITVRSEDQVYYQQTLKDLLGPYILFIAGVNGPLGKERVYVLTEPGPQDWAYLYRSLQATSSTLILVNPKVPPAEAFDAGVIKTSPKMLDNFLREYADEEYRGALALALAGLPFKTVVEVSKLAMSCYGAFTPEAVRLIRLQTCPPPVGLLPVALEDPHYHPPENLLSWLKNNQHLMRSRTVVSPRGLLFTGFPGTGKTCGAKYLARGLNQPLYMLDVGGLLSRWLGESDANLREALRQAEALSPCVLLLDEVDRLFAESADDPSTSRLLAAMLWWLQEHRSPVFTIMTSNRREAIPPELVRPGRIDREVIFPLLLYNDGFRLTMELVEALSEELGVGDVVIEKYNVLRFFSENHPKPHTPMTHAQAYEIAVGWVRKLLLTKQNQ